jgi:hypothetical protein
MAVWCIAAAVDDLCLFAQRGLLGKIIGAVEFGDVLGNDDALCILPGSVADAVPRIDRGLAVGGLRRKISVPGLDPGINNQAGTLFRLDDGETKAGITKKRAK